MNCSLIFKSKRHYIVHLFLYFFVFFSLTIKDKTKISLTIKILHLGQGSFTRKVRTIFTLKIIVSIFVKLFLILVLHLRQFFIVRILVKRATESVNRRRTDNTMTKRKSTKGQTTIYKLDQIRSEINLYKL